MKLFMLQKKRLLLWSLMNLVEHPVLFLWKIWSKKYLEILKMSTITVHISANKLQKMNMCFRGVWK